MERELGRDLGYVPDFANVPIEITELDVELDSADARILSRLKASGKFGETDGEVLRYVFFSWWIDRFMQGPKHFERK